MWTPYEVSVTAERNLVAENHTRLLKNSTVLCIGSHKAKMKVSDKLGP